MPEVLAEVFAEVLADNIHIIVIICVCMGINDFAYNAILTVRFAHPEGRGS